MSTYVFSDKDANDIVKSLKNDSFVNSFLKILGFDNDDIEKIFEGVEKELTTDSSKHILPSSKVDNNKKEYYHKLVTEYIDNEIRPWNSDKQSVNDDYAKLFEFVCWLSQK